MCDKFISNNCIFATKEDQKDNSISRFQKCKTNGKTKCKTLIKKKEILNYLNSKPAEAEFQVG